MAVEQLPDATEENRSASEGYAHEHRPLAGYATLTIVFGVALTVSLVSARRRRGGFPDPPGVFDLVTVGAATHKLSRLVTKDKVTSFVRAPFVEYEESAGHGEVSEEPRGRGLRLAIGELLACPYCIGQWIAAGFGAGLVAAPRLTRLLAFIFSAETIADFLQLAYKRAEKASP